MQLPYGLNLEMMQTKWRSILNPLLGNPSTQSIILPNISLVTGSNTVNHLLGRPLIGWRIIRQDAEANIWDSQNSNTQPILTLLLNSSANVTISLEVF